jgi:hypothetical protein
MVHRHNPFAITIYQRPTLLPRIEYLQPRSAKDCHIIEIAFLSEQGRSQGKPAEPQLSVHLTSMLQVKVMVSKYCFLIHNRIIGVSNKKGSEKVGKSAAV